VLARNVIEELQERRATPKAAVASLAIALAADPLPFLDEPGSIEGCARRRCDLATDERMRCNE
jgi:hypothetical protein